MNSNDRQRAYGSLKLPYGGMIFNKTMWPVNPTVRLHLLIIVRRTAGGGFILVPCRWVVERSFGWFGRWQRLS